MNHKGLLSIYLSLLLPFCTFALEPLDVFELKQFDNLPSASAITFYNNSLFAVGDDSPAIYKLNAELNIVSQIDIKNGVVNEQGRIPGATKADLEAVGVFNIHGSASLIFMGSGTQTDTRERALVLSLTNNSIKWINIKPFYRHLRKVAGLSSSEFINIEGLARDANQVFLLSRGSQGPNLVFSMPKQEFIDYIAGRIEQVETIAFFPITLAQIDGHQATLSGVEYSKALDALIMTASVEAHGGAILGSFITQLPMADLVKGKAIDLTHHSRLITHKKQALKSKVESVTLSISEDKQITGILAADNDDGTSQFMRFQF